MAKNVSTKFGDRRLVYLPPINIQPNKTPDVETLAPGRSDQRRDDGAIVPKDYAYGPPGPQQSDAVRNYFLNAPKRPEGNLVLDQPSPQRNVVSERIFEQLLQQANTETMQGYSKGQYPVVPAPQGSQQYMQYTNYGLQGMPPPPQQPQIQPSPVQSGMQPASQMLPQYNPYNAPVMPTQQPPMGGSHDPNEKHIYYGPNGEVIPGPPTQNRPQRGFTQDFAIEGLLRHGRLTAVNLFESAHGFPNIPEYLIKDLLIKYGQFELTLVRIVARGGQCYVHATPQIPMVQQPVPMQRPAPVPQVGNIPSQTEYVPVYLDEDEEFDHDKFMADYKAGKYKSGDPKSFRSMPPPEPRKIQEYRANPIEFESYKPALPPHRDPVTQDRLRTSRPITEDYHWQHNRPLVTRAWDTRRDIRPLQSLGHPSQRY